MGIIAKGTITLVNVNDAYSVLLTPDSCVIKADFDGTNPDLENAFTDITVVRGDVKQTFKLTLSSISAPSITYQQSAIDGYTKRIQLTNIPSTTLSGALTFAITTDDEFVADVTFTYSVVRETSMLDWILDWESNKTVIGDTYLITPKIFVGKKVENEEGLNSLTGVYIGPDDTNTAGIYGYKEGEDVFHINANGAMIGGWNILPDGISTTNDFGTVKIGSDGNLYYLDAKNDPIWGLLMDGSALFAKGNVQFFSSGNASFTGDIYAAKGYIGGWKIEEKALSSKAIRLDSEGHLIGVYAQIPTDNEVQDADTFRQHVSEYGGLYLHYKTDNNYGLVSYLHSVTKDDAVQTRMSFALGSTNKIASWTFDDDSLYMGEKVNMQKAYASVPGDITIGSNGMRGYGWYVDSDGDVSFLKGEVKFSNDGSGSIVGWNLNAKRLSNPNVAIVSDTANAGVYMSVADETDFDKMASSALTEHIRTNGGIYMKTSTDDVSFAAFDSSGNQIFNLQSKGVSSIAEWNIESDALFVGTKKVEANEFTDEAGSITISKSGIRGNKWRLEADGSGELSGGKISWTSDGEVTFDAKVSADNITAGTISACTIQSSEDGSAWKLSPDGSGHLANGNISWNKEGELTVNGKISASSGRIGYFEIGNAGLYYGTPGKWEDDSYKQSLSQIEPGIIRLQQEVGYGSAGDVANIKVAIGNNAEPGSAGENGWCRNVGYFYRRMNELYLPYYPAVKIISDNVINRDVALYTEGAIVCHGGLLSVGRFFNADSVNVLDFSFGTTVLVAVSQKNRTVFLPKLSMMKAMLNTTSKFISPVTIVAQYNNSENFNLTFTDGETSLYFRDYNGKQKNTHSMGPGDVFSILLIWDETNYYAQMLDLNS